MDLHWASIVGCILGAYIIGSIPFGLLASKAFRVQDPRTTGSGNIGATNVLRVSGKKAGALTLMGDLGKGFALVWLTKHLLTDEVWILSVAFAVVAGHVFSIFLGFQGGKGVATAFGAILGLELPLGLGLLLVWVISVLLFKYSAGGALAAFCSLPIMAIIFSYSMAFLVFSILISCLVIFRHKENIQRLLAGTEDKVGSPVS